MEEEEDERTEILRDRFRLSAISVVEAEGRKLGMEVSEPVVACVSDLAFKFSEQLAKDLELFSQHAGRKSVTMEDVILSAHRNDQLACLLRNLCSELKEKEPQNGRKKRKALKGEDSANT